MRLKPSLHNILVSYNDCFLGLVCCLNGYSLSVIHIIRVPFRVLEWRLSKWHFRGWLNLMPLSSEEVLVCCRLMTEATLSISTKFSTHQWKQLIFNYYLPKIGHLISACVHDWAASPLAPALYCAICPIPPLSSL